MTTIECIQEWYAQQCNGEWEHSYGIKVDSCDNPGWWVKIDVVGTNLQDKPFAPIKRGVDAHHRPQEPHWLSCEVKDNVFSGAGDSDQLETIFKVFLEWKDGFANQRFQAIGGSRPPQPEA